MVPNTPFIALTMCRQFKSLSRLPTPSFVQTGTDSFQSKCLSQQKKLTNSRSNCIVQLKNKKFAIIECFVYSRGTQTAIIRVASWQRPLKFIERIDEIFYWEVTFGEELSVIGCDNFLNKCSILQEQASVMTLSVLVEGFEHN